MPRALMISKNLVGDSLYIQPALEEWSRDHPDWEIDLLTNKDFIACIYEQMAIPGQLTTVYERRDPYDFEFTFNVNEAFRISDEQKCHISIAYGKMLGYEIERTGMPILAPDKSTAWVPRRVKFLVSDAQDHETDLVMLSMFSASCASRGKPPRPANKMLSWAHWIPILSMLRQVGDLAVLGGPTDRAPLPITEDEYYTAIPLERLARMMRDARLLVTVDNGMGHLAATQGTPTCLFYPKALGIHYIVPSGNPNLFLIHMDPMQLTVPEASLFVRQGLRRIGRNWK